MPKIKIDEADKYFSWYIRSRDRKCVRCNKPVRFNEKGLPTSHDASHYFGRGRESTRFEPDNVDTLCSMSCHTMWGSTDRESYRAFKIKQLGEVRFKMLCISAETYKKKDRKMELFKAKALLNTLK